VLQQNSLPNFLKAAPSGGSFQKIGCAIVFAQALINPNHIAVTIITVEEQMRGWLLRIRQADQPEKRIMAYARLKVAVQYFTDMQLLDFDLAAHRQYTVLQQQKIRIATQDLKIAAIALSQGGIIVTRNRKDFEKVPGLQIEDWTVVGCQVGFVDSRINRSIGFYLLKLSKRSGVLNRKIIQNPKSKIGTINQPGNSPTHSFVINLADRGTTAGKYYR
jgi:tRNA(fMet)-specific endonuclease VapC